MIAHVVMGVFEADATMAEIAGAMPLYASPAGGVLLSNDSQWYWGSYRGPSNSAPGWVWDLSYEAFGDDVAEVGSMSTDGGTLSIMGTGFRDGKPDSMVVVYGLGYAYHIDHGKFLFQGEGEPGPFGNPDPGPNPMWPPWFSAEIEDESPVTLHEASPEEVEEFWRRKAQESSDPPKSQGVVIRTEELDPGDNLWDDPEPEPEYDPEPEPEFEDWADPYEPPDTPDPSEIDWSIPRTAEELTALYEEYDL